MTAPQKNHPADPAETLADFEAKLTAWIEDNPDIPDMWTDTDDSEIEPALIPEVDDHPNTDRATTSPNSISAERACLSRAVIRIASEHNDRTPANSRCHASIVDRAGRGAD